MLLSTFNKLARSQPSKTTILYNHNNFVKNIINNINWYKLSSYAYLNLATQTVMWMQVAMFYKGQLIGWGFKACSTQTKPTSNHSIHRVKW